LLRIVLCALLAAASGGSARAQQPERRDVPLREAVVTAFVPDAAVSAAAPQQRIDSAAIRQLGITSTADALRRMAGVNVRDYGGAGGLKTVSVRGLGAGHTVVTYDGLTAGDTRSGQADLGRYRLERLAAIELHTTDEGDLLCPVRQLGAAVVALTSWQPDSLSPRRLHGAAGLTQAAFGTWNPTLRLSGGTRRNTRLSAAADFFHADNDYPFRLENGVLTHTERRRNSRMNAWNVEADLLQRIGRAARLTAKAAYDDNRRELPGPVHFYSNDTHEHLAERTAFAQARADAAAGRTRLFAAAKFTWDENRYRNFDGQYPGGVLEQNYRQRESYATVGAARSRKAFAAAIALDYVRNALHSNLCTDHDVSRDTYLSSLSLRYAPPRLVVTARLAGTLFRNHATDGADAAAGGQGLSPTLSLSWKAVAARRTVLYARLGYKESFRAPTFTECYFFHYGNTRLRPERTRQLGGGLTLEVRTDGPLARLLLTADAYANRVTDKITGIPVTLFLWRTVNLGRVRAAGLDATTSTTWRISSRHTLLATGSYSLLQAHDYTDSRRAAYRKQLAYTPRHSGAAAVTWENPWAGLVVGFVAASARWTTHEHAPGTRLPGYADGHVGLYRTLRLGAGTLELRADVQNVLNRQYEVIARYPMPGRAYKISAKFNF